MNTLYDQMYISDMEAAQHFQEVIVQYIFKIWSESLTTNKPVRQSLCLEDIVVWFQSTEVVHAILIKEGHISRFFDLVSSITIEVNLY